MSGLFEAALRGAGQGASFNWGDEGAAKLLGALPGPADPEGIPREYAAGSPEADYLQKFRRDNAAAAQAHPGAYTAGQMVGALPSAAAVPGGAGLSAAGRVAASGLAGGALGALSGAGGATEGNRVHEGAKGALLGSLLGTGSTAALEGAQAAAPVVRAALGRLRAPQVATENAPQINRAAMLPPAEDTAEAASSVVPKIPEAKTGVRESMIPKMDELAEHADVVHGDKMMQRPSSEKDVENFVRSRDKVKDALGRKPSNDNATLAQATVRPPKRLRPAPKQEPVQTELEFPKPEPEPPHWLDDPNIERLPTKGTPAEKGSYDTHVATFKTPQGIRQAIAKRGTGADDHLSLGIPGETMADREAAAYGVSKAIKPDAPVVPKTVSRDGESLQELVHAPNTGEIDAQVAADPEKYAQQMKDTNILDLLIRNPDRHGGNVLWNESPTAIDHNLTFGSGSRNSTPHRVPFEHPAFENAVTEAPDAATMNAISAKKVAEAVKPVKGISDSQKADMLGRLRDLQYNPDQLKGLSMPEVTQWMSMTPKQRGLSDVDLHDISQLLGQRSPIRPGTPLKLKGTKPLEGEQLSLDDLLK